MSGTRRKPSTPPRVVAWGGRFPTESDLRGAKRAVILREAASLFNRRGFHAASLDELAGGLGVTKAALYYYFPNKQALLKACLDDVMAAAFDNLARAKRAGVDGRDKLRRTVLGYLEHIIDDVSVAVVTVEENSLSASDRRQVIATRDRFEAALRDLVREGVRDGSIVPCDPKLVVFAMLGAVNWVTRWYHPQGEWTKAQIAASIADLLDRAVSTTPNGSLATPGPEASPPVRAAPRTRAKAAAPRRKPA